MKVIERSVEEKKVDKFYYVYRVWSLLALALMFVPNLNPARICGYVSKNLSLFSCGFFYNSLTEDCGRAFTKGWVTTGNFVLLYVSGMVICLGILAELVASAMSLGSLKLKNRANIVAIIASIAQFVGLAGIVGAFALVSNTPKADKVLPSFPLAGFVTFVVLAVGFLILSLLIILRLPKAGPDAEIDMESKFQLFLMFVPFILLAFLFSYLPLWGWRYAFFDYKSGLGLSMDNFVGFKWFKYLFNNAATSADVLRVLRNTLAMSGLGLLTSWCAMAFAIFLTEIKTNWFRKLVQTFTTIPNFISWVLVYAIALAIFANDGFLNSFLTSVTGEVHNTSYLIGDSHIWLKMLGWGMWKGIGWSAIIYIAGISGIDQQLYEAATVDGAGRFQRMWHITVPGLLPTYFVMLLMAIAGILSNGMDQYLVFENATNTEVITVLDLYVYQLGIGSGLIPMSTVIGMTKSIVSVILLFGANKISKLLRGESII